MKATYLLAYVERTVSSVFKSKITHIFDFPLLCLHPSSYLQLSFGFAQIRSPLTCLSNMQLIFTLRQTWSVSLIALFQGTPLITQKWEQSVFISGSGREAACDRQGPRGREALWHTGSQTHYHPMLPPHTAATGLVTCLLSFFKVFHDGLLINRNSQALVEVRSMHISLCQAGKFKSKAILWPSWVKRASRPTWAP